MNRMACSDVLGPMRILLAVALVPAVASAAPYDRMFELGTTMTYEETIRDSTPLGDKPTITTARSSCRVASVTKVAGETVSTIECDRESPVAGHWMSTRRGLWPLEGDTPEHVKKARREAPLIAARPRKRVRDRTDDEGVQVRSEVSKKGDRWCVDSEYHDAGGGSSMRLCFATGLLVEWTSGYTAWGDGGSEHSETTVLVRATR